jgi:hypothetical protein
MEGTRYHFSNSDLKKKFPQVNLIPASINSACHHHANDPSPNEDRFLSTNDYAPMKESLPAAG